MLLLTLACGEQWGEAPCGAGAAHREGGPRQVQLLSPLGRVAEQEGEAGRALPELTQSAQKSQPPPAPQLYAHPVGRLSSPAKAPGQR